MPIPSSINDLSTVAASNSPSGSEDLGTADDYLRVYASYIASLRDVVLSGTANLSTANLTYTGTLTGSTGVLNIGSGQIYKDASGNVGIGGSPTYALDLRTPSARLLIQPSTATNNALAMYSNTAGYAYTGLDNSVGTISGTPYALAFWHAGAYPAVFGTNNAERMRIDSSGNQINTPSNTPPTLTVNGQMNITPTSNTNVRISYRGSDGITRTANITLA